jgi:hypothetical protein
VGACLGGPTQKRVVYAGRGNVGPAGANGWERVSMYQIASANLRATSMRATLAPRWRPRRRLVASWMGGVGGMPSSVHCGLDQRPTQMLGAVLGKRPATVGSPRLIDPLDGEPCTPSWFENSPPAEIAAHIDLKMLLATGLTEI